MAPTQPRVCRVGGWGCAPARSLSIRRRRDSPPAVTRGENEGARESGPWIALFAAEPGSLSALAVDATLFRLPLGPRRCCKAANSAGSIPGIDARSSLHSSPSLCTAPLPVTLLRSRQRALVSLHSLLGLRTAAGSGFLESPTELWCIAHCAAWAQARVPVLLAFKSLLEQFPAAAVLAGLAQRDVGGFLLLRNDVVCNACFLECGTMCVYSAVFTGNNNSYFNRCRLANAPS